MEELNIDVDALESLPAELLVFFIQGLPYDIKAMIYADHFKLVLKHKKIVAVIKQPKSQALDPNELTKVIPKLLADKKLVQYMCLQDELFNRLCIAHTDGKKYFVNITDPDLNFALAWIMHLYH